MLARTDKTSNKCEVLETRFERLVYDRHDAVRHLAQCLQEWKVSIAGTIQGQANRVKAEEWVQAEKQMWQVARFRLKEDSSEAAWKDLLQEAKEVVLHQAKQALKDGEWGVQASRKTLEEGRMKGEDEESFERRMKAALKEQKGWITYQEDAKRWVENVQVHLKDLLKENTCEEEAEWQILKAKRVKLMDEA